MRTLLEDFELALARMVVERSERVDAHDRGDDEQQDGALAAVAVRVLRPAVEPQGEGEDEDRRGELDQAPGGDRLAHRRKNPQPRASVAALAMRSSAMTVRTTAPAPLATFLKVRTRFIGSSFRQQREIAVE